MRLSLSLAAVSLLLVAGPVSAGESVLLKIVDPQGLPIPGAHVEVRGSGTAASVVRMATSAKGEVTVDLPPPLEIQVTAAGFDPIVRRFADLPPEGIVLTMQPAMMHTTVEVVVREEAVPIEPGVGTALEIDRSGARSVFDAVDKLVPGAFVTRRGVMGYGIATNGTGAVSIRGVGGQPNTDILIVVDGRPDFMGLMGHPLPDFYSLSDAESVSVTQGPASVLYGSNAMGGVIEIKPSRPREGSETRLSASLGSYMTGQQRLSHGRSFERAFYSIHAGVDHTRGERDSAAYRGKNGSVAAGYTLSPFWKASLQGRYGHFHVEDPGPIHAPLSNSYARVGRGGYSANLDNSYSRSWGYARFYSSYGHHILTDGFRSVDDTTGGRVLQSFYLTQHLVLDAGSDIVVYGGRARNGLTRIDYGDHRLTTAAGFSRVQWTPRSRLRLSSGLRYDHNSVHGAVAAPEFGTVWGFSDNYSVGVAVARGFRNPTIRELYLFPAPNPLLEPQNLWNYQATFQARPWSELQTVLTAYYADLTNLIVTTGRFPNLQMTNGGRAINRGLELITRWRPARRFQINNGYAYLRSTNLAPYIPQHKWNSSIETDTGKAFLQVGASVVGSRWGDSRKTYRLGGFTAANLKFTVPVGRHYSAFVLADNLFDHRYEVVPGYPMPGVNAMGGISIRF